MDCIVHFFFFLLFFTLTKPPVLSLQLTKIHLAPILFISHQYFSKPMIFSSVLRFILGLCLNYIAQFTVYGDGTPNTTVPHVYVVLIVGQMLWTLSRIFLFNEVYRIGSTLQQLAMLWLVAVAMVAVAMVAVATWAQKILEKIFYTILQNIVFMKMMMVPSPNYLECNLIFTPLFQFYIQVSHLMYHMIHF